MKNVKKHWLAILVWSPPIAFITLMIGYLMFKSFKFIWGLLMASDIKSVPNMNLDGVISLVWIKIFILVFIWEIVGMVFLAFKKN